jgi:hypothetical protein
MAGCALKFRWPQEQMDTLAALWDTSKSASEIAHEMGYSRSAILGKAHRMQLTDRAPTPARFKPGYVNPTPVVKAAPTPKAKKAIVLKPGQSKTSADYRRQFSGTGQLSKSQLQAMFSLAVTNTAAMQDLIA